MLLLRFYGKKCIYSIELVQGVFFIRVGGGCATYSNYTYSKQVLFLIKATAMPNLSAITLLLAEFLHVLGLVTISGTSEPLPFDELTALSLSYFQHTFFLLLLIRYLKQRSCHGLLMSHRLNHGMLAQLSQQTR